MVNLKKYSFLIGLFFLVQPNFAHKPKSIFEFKDNVKFYMKSSWDFAEFLKVKVITNLASDLLKENNEKDTLIIKYQHSKSSNLVDEYLLEYKKTKFLSNNRNKVIFIELTNDNLDVELVLNLIDFSIKNKKKLDKYNLTVDYFDRYTSVKKGTQKITNVSLINAVAYQISSVNIQHLMKKEIEVFKNEIFKIKWMNSIYSFHYQKEKENTILEVSDKVLYSYQEVNDGLVVFVDDSNFYFINNEGIKSKKHYLQCNSEFYFFGNRQNKNYELISLSGDNYFYNGNRDRLYKEISD